MSQEERELNQEKFINLLQSSNLIQSLGREGLCQTIEINPNELHFLTLTSNEGFAVQLISHLYQTRNKKALCLLFNKIEEKLKRGDWKNDLETIRGQLKCSSSSSGSAPSVNPPHQTYPAESSSKAPWEQLGGGVKVVGVVVLGGLLLLGIRSAIFPKNPSPSHQSAPSTSNDNSSYPCSEGYTFDGTGPGPSGDYAGRCKPTSSNTGAKEYPCNVPPNTTGCSKPLSNGRGAE